MNKRYRNNANAFIRDKPYAYSWDASDLSKLNGKKFHAADNRNMLESELIVKRMALFGSVSVITSD